MKKWYWYLPKLTPVQVEKLKEGLMSSFRMHLDLAIPTIGWQSRKKMLWVNFTTSSPVYSRISENIGHYINGFYSAAEIGSWQVI